MKRLLTFLALTCAAATSFAATLNPVQLLNPAGSTAGQTIVSTGASTAPGWAAVPLSGLSSMAANTVVANATGSTAAPTAFVMPSCLGSGTALNWNPGSGFVCNTTLNAATLNGATFASPGSIGGTTAGSGSFTTISASGLITPSSSAGIKGTTAADSANAGSIGEYLTGTASGVSLTSAASANCASVSLTAGDWDVTGQVTFTPAGSTTMSGYNVGISTTSASLQANGNLSLNLTLATGLGQIVATPLVRVNVSSTTTVYLVGNLTFGTSTATCGGFIHARRVR